MDSISNLCMSLKQILDVKKVECRLTTGTDSDGESTCETCLQLAALSLKVDISIEDIASPEYELGLRSCEVVLQLNKGSKPVSASTTKARDTSGLELSI